MKIDASWLVSGPTAQVFAALGDRGHSVFAVGGAVRDALVGRAIVDIDLATDALPDAMIAACAAAGLKTIPTGIDHGTVTILAGDVPHEVTTFRRDVETDGRHAVVAFGGDVQSDATRRDFTMNALYATQDGTVLDPVGGVPDLMAGRVRFVGKASARITEDALRILRFFRFHAWYGDPDGGIDPTALAAISEGQDGLAAVSGERVGQEMRKLLGAPDPAPAVASMAASGVLARIVPGAEASMLAPLVHLDQGFAPRWLRRLAVIGGESAGLRLSKKETRGLKMIRQAMEMTPAEAAWRVSPESALDGALVLAASTGVGLPKDVKRQIERGRVAEFPLNGDDLLGHFKTGREVGAALRRAQDIWIKSDFTAQKHELLRAIGIG